MDQEKSAEKVLECGVCQEKVSLLHWNEHIGKEHNYLAWKIGDTPLVIILKIISLCGPRHTTIFSDRPFRRSART